MIKLSGVQLSVSSYEYTVATKRVVKSIANRIGDISYTVGLSSPEIEMEVWLAPSQFQTISNILLEQKLRLLWLVDRVISVFPLEVSLPRNPFNISRCRLRLKVVEKGIGYLHTLVDDATLIDVDGEIESDEINLLYGSLASTVNWE